ncbi:MAG TPA: MnhB domain-containing protein [Mycobacteriales bacterium]|nr:MnhB domain-containing protein [Mycobacteriales bacterium]
MTRGLRLLLFAGGAAATVVLLVFGVLGLPHFGSSFHPYRDHAVPAAVSHKTANVVSSINFDLRGLDTFGEETILLASVVGAAVLLRPAEDEDEKRPLSGGRILDSTRLVGYLLLPVTLLIGLDTVLHGALTPGGGFQGGVVLGTGIHLLYVAGSYQALERARPEDLFEYGEALGTGAFACVGIAGLLAGAGFLGNLLPQGAFGSLLSSGSVLLLSAAVGVEVASGVVVLLARFLDQALRVGKDTPR